MPDTAASPFASVLVVGGTGHGRRDLADELARLAATAVRVSVIDDLAALADAPASGSLILLLAPADAAAEAEDLRWRDALTRAQLPYCVLHGDPAARLAAAWHLIRARVPDAPPADTAPPPSSAWQWRCDKCSDPACEHRLFRDLLAGRQSAAPAH